MIPQRNLSLVSNQLLKQYRGRRIPETVIERDYCLAWLLNGIAASRLRPVLTFKGGTALKRCYFADYRYSEDLNFTLTEAVPLEQILIELEKVYEWVADACGIVFRFDREDGQSHTNSHTIYLGYQGPLPASNDVKVDITIREMITQPIQDRPVLRGDEEFFDLPADRTIRTYALEEIGIEKTMALADRARNEPRDLFDLWHLTTNARVQLGPLSSALQTKLEFREKPGTELLAAIQAKEDRLGTL